MKNTRIVGLTLGVLLFVVSPLLAQSDENDTRAENERENAEEKTVELGNLTWHNSLERARKRAKKKNQPIILLRVLGHLNDGL